MASTLAPPPGAELEVPRPVARARRPRRSVTRYVLRTIVAGYLLMLVAWPTFMVVQHTFADGLDALRTTLADPSVQFSLRLTVIVALIATAINAVFGVGISMLLVRYDFRGKRLLSNLLDLPLAVSPIVVGLALMLVYGGRTGWFGPTLESAGFQVAFAIPGIVMATAFVALPLMIREVVPILEEIGVEQEQAATSLGATAAQVFRKVTLPAMKWAVVYGLVLTLARSLGEFGAVKVISGNLAMTTQTATLLVEQKYQDFEQAQAYSMAFLLASVSVICIVVVSLLRPESSRPER